MIARFPKYITGKKGIGIRLGMTEIADTVHVCIEADLKVTLTPEETLGKRSVRFLDF